ncbi:related to alpha-1,6-mannosyltransferase [Phialocephala subalpina]|uniref:Related to alpha-1,6-mannosyltransferase n=1 Tax=Phialocephala subalpina TaxID=576137 RepID=A0A1L7WZX5_9HELO|nr:related to alpha-1,6-mannosyltransferase [Phialocephala subalpina]
MFLSNWHLALKLSSTALLLIFFFPSYIWPATDKNTTPIPVPPSRTTTSALETTPSATAIPEKIWYKLGPRGLTQQAREWINSCLDKNPAYESEFLTDLSGDAYVKEKFAHRPDIVEAFLALQFPILKADFLRYLLLFNEGGIYSDLDVSCEDTPIRDWIPAQYKEDASVIVGWEFDVGWGDSFVRQFATWTIMARPRSPHILMVLDDILEALREKTEEHNVTIANMTWTMVGDVVDFTGPRRMTRSILKSLKATLGGKFDERSIAALYEPKLVGDVLILPGYSFALSSNHYKPEDKQGPALVTHHFDGSWKNDHGGEAADAVP